MEAITPLRTVSAVLLAAGLVGASTANAASITYYLDQTNSAVYLDGTNYLTVTIDDQGTPGYINFTVDVINAQFNPTAGSFGIQNFAFNITGNSIVLPDSPNAAWILPTNWAADYNLAGVPPPNNADGFGDFDVQLSTSGAANRKDPLQFSINVAGDTINSYFAPSLGTAGQGNAWFAAHVAGYTVPGETSAWFGGGNGENLPPNAVPVPAAAWLFGSGLLGMVGIARRKKAG